MVRSMTGYGRSEGILQTATIVAEIRSVNHRFLDISLRIPRSFISLEQNIKKLIASYTTRGKVEVSLQLDASANAQSQLVLNENNARYIHDLLQQIKGQISFDGPVELSSMLAFKEYLFKENQESLEDDMLWEMLLPCLEEALGSLQTMQQDEGAEILKDILVRLNTIEKTLDTIEQSAETSVAGRRAALTERIRLLCSDISMDEGRMLQETAILADKSDITEELVRAKTHVTQFRRWLDTEEPLGRKLDFLIQEIHREVNTMGAKASDAEISVHVVLIKNELEKIREQVQNIM